MEHLLPAIVAVLAPTPFALILIGVALGIVIGSIPGLTGAMLIALTLPLTFYMESINALILLVAMYVGSISGGLITAILLRMPGTPAAIMTTFDGYPMARAGQPGRALGLAIGASFVGGMISWAFLVLLSPPLARLALTFGPFEYFTMVLMALVLIASLSRGSFVKGLLAGLLGMLIAIPGVDPAGGRLRLTFGFHELDAGFNLLPVLIGVFAVSQVIKDIIEIDRPVEKIAFASRGILMTLADYRRHAVNLVRSSVIGTWVGILPGIGASIGSMMAYTAAKSFSRTPERFGTGHEEGITASESANNATVGGALIPLVTMGIPGSTIDAILIAAMIIHGLQPGPLLFVQSPNVVYAMIAACLIANIVMFVMMLSTAGWIARLVDVPRALLLPSILLFCVLGSYALNNRMFDVWVMLGFGVLGYFLERCKVPLGPFVIGFVLEQIAETQLRAALMESGGEILPLLSRPISLGFIAVALVLLLVPLWNERQARAVSADRKQP
ncbi:MAG: tripartite tricarboxylate transporter permease [Geminicoccaceae bacterium]